MMMISSKQLYSSYVLLAMICLYSSDHMANTGTSADAVNCSQVNIDYIERSNMTDAERLAEMDKAFFTSINRFKLCDPTDPTDQSATSSASTNETSQADDAASIAKETDTSKPTEADRTGENNAGESAQESAIDVTEISTSPDELPIESIASPLITGTESESVESAIPPVSSPVPTDNVVNNNQPKKRATSQTTANLARGTIPTDIPDVDNDDVVAQQIRLAAETEKDDIKKAKLWNEYRKYKGLPVKVDEQ